MSRFDTVPVKKPGRNLFDMSHDVKATYKFDYVYPFLCEEIVPGDTFNCRAEVFMRSMPLLTPVMHNVDMFLWYVFVPNRLVWDADKKDDWKVFITGGEQGNANPVKPHFTWDLIHDVYWNALSLGYNQPKIKAWCSEGSLMDHLGMPVLDSGTEELLASEEGTLSLEKIDALPLRAYAFAWNELFRNQNVQDEIEFSYDSGELSRADMAELLQLRRKNLEKDYFTSCLPWQQRGEAYPMPLDTSNATLGALEEYLTLNVNDTGEIDADTIYDQNGSLGEWLINVDTNGKLTANEYDGGVARENVLLISVGNKVKIPLETLANNLSLQGVSVGTINDLRTAYRIQTWLENNARCGSRYIEQILAHFGVRSSDARLQRPELLGGGKIPLIITDIEQQSGTVDNAEFITPQGNLSGKGTMYGKTGGFRKSFEEHGWLFGLLSIVPRTSYQQQLPRKYTRMNRLDYYFPEFARLSEQAVLRKEVWFTPNYDYDAFMQDVFGYQERFCEMRYIPSSVRGQLRTTLQAWHLGRVFDSPQFLNSDFVEAKTRANIFAIEDVQQEKADPFVCQIHNDVKAVRPLPKFVVPSL